MRGLLESERKGEPRGGGGTSSVPNGLERLEGPEGPEEGRAAAVALLYATPDRQPSTFSAAIH